MSMWGELTKQSKSAQVNFPSAEGNSAAVKCNHIQRSLDYLSEVEQKWKSGLFYTHGKRPN